MSELTEKEFGQKAILTLLANPEFVIACDKRAREGRQKLSYTISENCKQFVSFLSKDTPKN